MTYHLLDAAAQGAEMAQEEISGATAAKVGKLMTECLLPHGARFYQEILSDEEHVRHARWIQGYILANKKHQITKRDVAKACHELARKPEEIERAMEVLVVTGWVFPADGRTWKTKAPRWKVNQVARRLFAERGIQEKTRREDVMRRIKQASKELGMKEAGCEIQ